jgi:membrane protein implicated in regulation of membrane protease activity
VPIDSLVGEEVVLLGDLPAGGEGKAELRGVPWSARTASGAALRAGQRCRVERIDGLTLWVRAEDAAPRQHPTSQP